MSGAARGPAGCRRHAKLPGANAAAGSQATLVGPTELSILAVRLIFAICLYAAVAMILLALRRDLGRAAEPSPPPASAGPPAGPGRPARLVLLAAAAVDGSPGRVVALRGEVTIGRRPPAEVLLHDDAVSGRHARLWPADDAWLVEDLGSTNGTYVNGRRLAAPAPLRPGDVLVTGQAAWRYDEAPVS